MNKRINNKTLIESVDKNNIKTKQTTINMLKQIKEENG